VQGTSDILQRQQRLQGFTRVYHRQKAEHEMAESKGGAKGVNKMVFGK